MKNDSMLESRIKHMAAKLDAQSEIITDGISQLQEADKRLKKPLTGQKKYTVSYDFYGDKIVKPFTTLFDLGMEINRILDETNVLSNTVHITTEDI